MGLSIIDGGFIEVDFRIQFELVFNFLSGLLIFYDGFEL